MRSAATKAREKRYRQSAKGKLSTAAATKKYRQRTRYGITPEMYDSMLDQQRGVCAICLSPDSRCLSVDHDHKTGAVRGLLCSTCNRGLGHFDDSQDRMFRAVKYLSGVLSF